MRSMRGKIRWRRHRIREKFEEAWTMGWDTALTVSFTGSILISRDTSRLCNSCRQPSSITPGIPASVSSVRGGNHGLPARRGQTPGFRVCQPLLHDPKPSGGEPSVAVRPIFTSPRLATATTDRGLSGISKTGNRHPQRDCYFDINKIRGFRLFYCGGGIFAWMIEILRCLDNSQGKES